MKVKYSTKNGLMEFELDASKSKELFKALNIIQDIFDNEKCGLCGCDELRYVVRNVKDNEYYELQCTNDECLGRLSFGESRSGGTLFAKRRLKNGLPARQDDEPPFDWSTNGWYKFNPDNKAKKPTKKSSRKTSEDDVPF